MGIRNWLSNMQQHGDDAAVRRAEGAMRSGSPEEREILAGDIEGLAAERSAEQRVGEQSVRDIDRLGGF
jgi:hypothetical protein